MREFFIGDCHVYDLFDRVMVEVAVGNIRHVQEHPCEKLEGQKGFKLLGNVDCHELKELDEEQGEGFPLFGGVERGEGERYQVL